MRSRAGRAWAVLAALALSLPLSLALSLPAAAAELLPIPAPSYAGMEEAVRDQLRQGLAELEAMAARGDVGAGDLAEAYGTLGQIYLAYDHGRPAEACLRNARTLDGEDFRWPYLLGALYQNERRLEEAASNFDAALTLGPQDLPALLRRGNVHLLAGQPAAATARFEAALEVDPASAAAFAGLGKAAAAAGENGAAVRAFERALELQPQASALRYPLAMAHRELGDLDAARRHLAARGDVEAGFADPLVQGLLGLATGSGIHLMFGNRALRKGRVELALERYRQAIAANPRNAEAHVALAAALARQGDVAGAVEHYSTALALTPENPRLHYNLGTLLAEGGEAEQARRHFAAALELAPDYANARFNLAAALLEAGRYQEAWDHWQKLLELEPEDRASRFHAARTLHRLGRAEEAAALLAALVAEDPGRIPPRLELAALHLARGDEAAAEAELEAILDLPGPPQDGADADDKALAHHRLAELLARQGRFAEAARHFRAVLARRPRNLEARFGEAMALLLGERYGELRGRLEEGLEVLPRSPELAHLLARFLATCPDAEPRDGERALELARALFARHQRPDVAETVAMAYAELGRFADAVAWQRRLVAEAERAGADAHAARLRRRLAAYERGEPCRAPWLAPAP